MGIMDKYVANAPTLASEEPSNTVEAGKYLGEIVGGKCTLREGTSGAGNPYRFGEVNVQIRINEGAKKGQNFFGKLNLGFEEANDPNLSEEERKSQSSRRLYFIQHTYDALGFGKKLDPSWNRSESPHPTKPGKTVTKFSGRVLSQANVADICADESDGNDLIGLLKGCVAIFNVSEDDVMTKRGEPVKVNNLKGVEAATDANLNKLRSSHNSQSGPASPASTSLYA